MHAVFVALNRFDTIPACDIQTDGHMAIVYIAQHLGIVRMHKRANSLHIVTNNVLNAELRIT